MPRFFIEKSAVTESGGKKLARITGQDAAHITKSLRMRAGESVTVCDAECREYSCVIIETDTDAVVAEVKSECASLSEPPYKAVVYQCLPKGDKLEGIVMKAVECGAYAVVPVLSERCVSRPDKASGEKKTARLNKIAAEAAGQCGRAILPEVREIACFAHAVTEASAATLPLFFYEDTSGEQSLREALDNFCERLQSGDKARFRKTGGYTVRLTEADSGMSGRSETDDKTDGCSVADDNTNGCSETDDNTNGCSVTDDRTDGCSVADGISRHEPFTVSLFIGPEGGFSVNEAAAARDAGMIHCALGKRILRTETVATHVLACLSLYFEL